VDEEGTVRLIPQLINFYPEDTDAALGSLGRMGDAVLRFLHEITNVDEVWHSFHELLAMVLDEFKELSRDSEKQQDIIRFILTFRALSQEWEEEANQGNSIRRFWKDRLEEEINEAKGKTTSETMVLERPDRSPIKIEMVQAPSGTFLMGDESDRPIHRVELTKPFMIAKFPVTQELYGAVTGDWPSRFKGNELPVETITWFDAVRFCNELSKEFNLEQAYRIDGEKVQWNQKSSGFRLPTEAEWEYACRAGSTTRFACGDLESSLGTMGWFEENSGGNTHPVGQKEPNAWGLFDMHGNVWEWVWDWHARYPDSPVRNPTGPKGGGSYRVIRGGYWYGDARYCRSAIRFGRRPDYRFDSLGFRLSRSVSLGP